MKIFEIIPQLSQGGAERFVIDLCNELVKKNDVTLVILHDIDKYGFFKKELVGSVRLISMNKAKGIDWKLFFQLSRLIRKEKPDVVHTHLRGILYPIMTYVFPSKIKFFHTVHSDAYREAGGFVSRWCRKFAFGFRCIHPITISEESQHSFKEFYHLPSTLIYNGRPAYEDVNDISIVMKEFSELKTNPNAKLIVNVARIAKVKNQIALAKAIDSLNHNGHAIELAIVGDVGDEEIIHEISSLQSPYVHLLGVRNNPRDYIKVSDAFCLTSLYEGMPITLIECFSVGAIPLCTPVGGIINMINNGENGLLAESSAQKDIEDMLVRFLSLDGTSIENIKRHSKASFHSFDIAACAAKYIQTFNSL